MKLRTLQLSIALPLAIVLLSLYWQSGQPSEVGAQGPTNGAPDVVRLIGPVSMDKDLRTLPTAPSTTPVQSRPTLRRYPAISSQSAADVNQSAPQTNAPLAPATMPTPTLTFDGINSAASGCMCLPPDTQGDVGPNHYIQNVNVSFKIFDKTGATLSGPTTFDMLWLGAATLTPCDTSHQGDPVVFYDHLADRWVLTDFAFPGTLPGVGPFYECIAVSKTSDPVSGGWWLYALQHDSAHPTWVGDYPKFGMWPDAYYLTVNLFDGPTLAFEGVRVFALDRSKMIAGIGAPAPVAVSFLLTTTALGDSYSLLAATFRYGAPPAGRDEFFAAIDSPPTGAVVLNKVHMWKFHVDFTTPALSTFGVGPTHTPNGNVTVAPFSDAFTSVSTLLVPQPGTTRKLDTLGDKLMMNLWYQNRGGDESLWATHTISNSTSTAIRWYQFDVTGAAIPAAPIQQQSFDNGGDGLYRWMPSLSVDKDGDMAVGYSVSSSVLTPSIRYAGRLLAGALNTLSQGEATMTAGVGVQTHSSGRWGDYSAMSIDPSSGCKFWYTQEYYPATSSASWSTRIGTFTMPGVATCSVPTAVTLVQSSVQMQSTLNPPAMWLWSGALLGALGLLFAVVILRRRRA